MAKEKVDAYDIGGLERSLNDSATRVSAVWVSFVVFSLYLILAATTVTHRQLLLAEPIKLPVLNIDLPVFGFYLVSPAIFLVFHYYVLLQVILLNRTAATYNAALDKAIKSPVENASLRQRLANTLFAQVFAGSPREREGFVGLSLRATSWVTLVILPIIVLIVFNFSFLAYHSSFVTGAHRAILSLDLLILFILWPLVANASSDFRLKRTFFRPHVALGISLLVAFISSVTFPGEPHAGAFRRMFGNSDLCSADYLSRFNRINVSRQQVINTERLARIEASGRERSFEPYEGERTLDLSRRNLTCGVLDGADLRRADLREADLTGASLEGAFLQGAELSRATLNFAQLSRTKLDSANLEETKVMGALLSDASLRGASMKSTMLQTSDLTGADLQGAEMDRARLYLTTLVGTDFRGAMMSGAYLLDAKAYGAFFDGAALTYLQVSEFAATSFRATYLANANLQGASFNNPEYEEKPETDLTDAWLHRPLLWRTGSANCKVAKVIAPRFDEVIAKHGFGEMKATPEELEKQIRGVTSELPSELTAQKFENDVREALKEDKETQSKDRANWEACATKGVDPDYVQRLVAYLVQLGCGHEPEYQYRIRGIARNWVIGVAKDAPTATIAYKLSTLFLDAEKCPSEKAFNSQERSSLRDVRGWDLK